jgi:hypothetical protein
MLHSRQHDREGRPPVAFDYAQYFGEIKLTQDLLTNRDDRSWRLASPRDGERHDVVLYLGCNVLRTSHLVQTATAVFDQLGLDYVAVGGPTYCCGIQHHRRGQEASGERYANHTIALLQRMAPREVVMWCPSCIHFYDEVLQAELPFPKRHTTEFLADRLERGDFTFTRRVEATVALHAAGATHLAGIYHGCHRDLCRFEAERPIVVEHYLTIFARALGIEFEDVYKKYVLLGDADRILEDATPCMAANGVDPAAARDLVLKTFPRR